MSDLEARLAAARARTAAAESKRPAVDPLLADVEAAEYAAARAEAVTQATCELGAEGRFFVVIDTGSVPVVVKRPHSAVFRRFSDLDAPKHLDVEALCKPCVHSPDRAKLDVVLEEQPAVLNRIAVAVGRLAGARREDQAPKS